MGKRGEMRGLMMEKLKREKRWEKRKLKGREGKDIRKRTTSDGREEIRRGKEG